MGEPHGLAQINTGHSSAFTPDTLMIYDPNKINLHPPTPQPLFVPTYLRSSTFLHGHFPHLGLQFVARVKALVSSLQGKQDLWEENICYVPEILLGDSFFFFFLPYAFSRKGSGSWKTSMQLDRSGLKAGCSPWWSEHCSYFQHSVLLDRGQEFKGDSGYLHFFVFCFY